MYDLPKLLIRNKKRHQRLKENYDFTINLTLKKY